MKTSWVAATMLLTSCSLVFDQPVRSPTPGEAPITQDELEACNPSSHAPTADAIVGLVLTALGATIALNTQTTCTTKGSFPDTVTTCTSQPPQPLAGIPIALVGVGLIASAGVGYHRVTACRQAREIAAGSGTTED